MEQTVVNATQEFLRDSLDKATSRIAQLEEHISKVTQRSYTEAAERNNIINEMQEWTLEAMEHGTIDEFTAQSIADICHFELLKEFEVEVSVEYSITVNAPNQEAAADLINDIDFDSVSEPQGVTYLSSSVSRIDI
jgi:hypothetical protein